MKFAILLAVIASASATAIVGFANTGVSAVSRSEDGFGNYAFGYNEDHATGGSFRKEKGGPGVQVGSYGLRDADGRQRTVNYVADALGFRASISSNEPGVDPAQPAAATTLNGFAHVAPAIAVAHAPLAAPVAMATPVMARTFAAPIAAPIAARHFMAAAPAAMITPYSYNSAVNHIAAPISAPMFAAPLMAKAAFAAPAVYGKSLFF